MIWATTLAGDQKMPPQDMALWHRIILNWRQVTIREKAFFKLPLLTKSRYFWEMRTAVNLFWENFKVKRWKDEKSALRQICKQSLLKWPWSSISFPCVLTFPQFATLKAWTNFPLSCHFSTNLLLFVKMLCKPQVLTAPVNYSPLSFPHVYALCTY